MVSAAGPRIWIQLITNASRYQLAAFSFRTVASTSQHRSETVEQYLPDNYSKIRAQQGKAWADRLIRRSIFERMSVQQILLCLREDDMSITGRFLGPRSSIVSSRAASSFTTFVTKTFVFSCAMWAPQVCRGVCRCLHLPEPI